MVFELSKFLSISFTSSSSLVYVCQFKSSAETLDAVSYEGKKGKNRLKLSSKRASEGKKGSCYGGNERIYSTKNSYG